MVSGGGTVHCPVFGLSAACFGIRTQRRELVSPQGVWKAFPAAMLFPLLHFFLVTVLQPVGYTAVMYSLFSQLPGTGCRDAKDEEQT